jgi:hypothetical protein
MTLGVTAKILDLGCTIMTPLKLEREERFATPKPTWSQIGIGQFAI